MSIIILTGPPASGKNTVAPLIARQRTRCAIIDVDQVRWMLAHPHVAPWDGEEGKRQCRFGVENACLLAQRFADDGCDVLLLDYLWDYTVPIYQQGLAGHQPKTILLMPSLAETQSRNQVRGWLPVHEVEMLYTQLQTLKDYDLRIDNSKLPVEALATEILKYMESRMS